MNSLVQRPQTQGFLAILLVLAGIGHHLIQFVVVKSASASDRHREAPVEI